MKLSTVRMTIGLVIVVTLSYFFNREGFFTPLSSDVSPAPFELDTVSLREPFASFFPSPSVSDTAQADLLQNVQKLVRDEILLARQVKSLKEQEEREEQEEVDNPSERQGRGYRRHCHKEQEQDPYRCPKNLDGSCPPIPDLTQYIRKDQIPCSGCSVNY